MNRCDRCGDAVAEKAHEWFRDERFEPAVECVCSDCMTEKEKECA